MVWYPPRIITTYAYLQKLMHHKIHDLKNKKSCLLYTLSYSKIC